jgi:hypothetical protein
VHRGVLFVARISFVKTDVTPEQWRCVSEYEKLNGLSLFLILFYEGNSKTLILQGLSNMTARGRVLTFEENPKVHHCAPPLS